VAEISQQAVKLSPHQLSFLI